MVFSFKQFTIRNFNIRNEKKVDLKYSELPISNHNGGGGTQGSDQSMSQKSDYADIKLSPYPLPPPPAAAVDNSNPRVNSARSEYVSVPVNGPSHSPYVHLPS